MVDWQSTAFVFPGQGSQIVGMGKDAAEQYPAAHQIFEEADDILGFKLSELCFDGPQERLDQTRYTQPALYVSSVALLRALESEFPDASAIAMAGHSLGEFTALMASKAFSFANGLELVRLRGELMEEAGNSNPGGMAAVLAMDVDVVRSQCAQAQNQTGGTLVLANDNCPGQLVISGDQQTLDVGIELLKAAGAKRVVPLAVSIAAHSPLMASVAASLTERINQTSIHSPVVPVYGNVSAVPLDSADAIQEELRRQLTEAVRWTETVQGMIASGVTTFIEIGSKDVLTGLLKRIDRSAQGIALNNAAAIQALKHPA
jgi:[acyl-carrier-protein] S-malonyltransferase